jgi:hypothetical protein
MNSLVAALSPERRLGSGAIVIFVLSIRAPASMNLLKDFTISRDLAGIASSRRSDLGPGWFTSLVAGRQHSQLHVDSGLLSMGNKCRENYLEIIHFEY